MTHFKSDVDYSPSYPAAGACTRGLGLLRLCAVAAWVAALVACAQTPTVPATESAPPEATVAPSPETVAVPPDNPASAPAAVPTPLPAAPAVLPPPEPKTLPAAATIAPPASKPAALVMSAALTPGYYVHVGAFAVPENANKAYQKLRQAGLAPVAQTLTQRKRTLTRVGAGPFPSRAAAQAAAKTISTIPLDTLIGKH